MREEELTFYSSPTAAAQQPRARLSSIRHLCNGRRLSGADEQPNFVIISLFLPVVKAGSAARTYLLSKHRKRRRATIPDPDGGMRRIACSYISWLVAGLCMLARIAGVCQFW